MPGVALIFAKTGAPIDERRLADLAGRLSYRGHHVALWHRGPIGVARITRTAAAGIVATRQWQLAFDGRLDNRADLAAALGRARPDDSGADDAALAAAAIERWDGDAITRLIGDFAIAAAHQDGRRALLARDIRGLRPLYYRDDHRELVCASDMQSLVRGAPAPINDGLVAEWLTGAPASHGETLYQGVYRLPMAHLLDVTSGATKRQQYWTPSVDGTIARRNDEQRAGLFTEVLQTAVRARVDGADRAALWLSGGLDSSTLAVMMRDACDRPWQCFTLVHPASGIDERAFARPVAAAMGAPHTVIAADDVTLDDMSADIAATLDVPAPPNGLQSAAGRREVAAAGFAVALSGLGSDEWFGGSFLSYGDLARAGRYRELVRTVWADRHREESTGVRLQIAAWALCPPWLQRGVRAALNRKIAPAWISPAFAARTSLEDRLRANEIASPQFDLLSQRALYDDNIRGGYVAGTEMQERANERCGLDERYPFHDRRVIELSLALPEADRWSGGRYKDVIRRAMTGRLPPLVVERQASPNANALVAATLERIGGRRFFEHLSIAEPGWVDRQAVLKLWERYRQRPAHPGVEVWQLWAIAAMELWWVHAAGAAARQGEPIRVA